MTLAQRLKKARKAAGITQAALSRMTSVTQQQISKLESGKSTETTAIVDIADALGVSPSWLSSQRGSMYATERPPPAAMQIKEPAGTYGQTSPATESLIDQILISTETGALTPALATAIRQMVTALPQKP